MYVDITVRASQSRSRGYFAHLLTALAACGVMGFGYIQGYIPINLQFTIASHPIQIAFLQAEFSVLSFAGFLAISALLFVVATTRDGMKQSRPDETPGLTAIIPVYQDGNVLSRSVESLLDAEYPHLSICVVYETDDSESRRVATTLATDYVNVTALENTRYPGTKAGAINYASEMAETPLIAVFDADESVHPFFPSRAVARICNGADIVQGRTIPEPTNGIIESIAYYESILLNQLSRRVLYLVTDFRMAASRAIVMRQSALTATGGYNESLLTEDFGFAYQCYRQNLTVVEELSSPSIIRSAHTARDWWGQRKRWMTGYAQVLILVGVTAVRQPSFRNILSLGICLSTVGGSLLMLSIVSKMGVLIALDAFTSATIPTALIILTAMLVRLYDRHGGATTAPNWHLVFIPLIFPFYSLVSIKALFEYFLTWDGSWYHTKKEV